MQSSNDDCSASGAGLGPGAHAIVLSHRIAQNTEQELGTGNMLSSVRVTEQQLWPEFAKKPSCVQKMTCSRYLCNRTRVSSYVCAHRWLWTR